LIELETIPCVKLSDGCTISGLSLHFQEWEIRPVR